MRYVWLSVSALATGFGIWATHFIAMLAYAPGVPSGYNVSLTLASLVFAIVTLARASLSRCRRHCQEAG